MRSPDRMISWSSAMTTEVTGPPASVAVAPGPSFGHRVVAAAAFAAFAVHAVLRPVNRIQTWAWRAVLAGLVLETLGIGGACFTPWLDQFYLGVGTPGIFMGLVGGTVLGISSLRRGPLPRVTAVILTLGLLNEIVLSTFVYAGGAVVPTLLAWAIAARAAARVATSPDPTRMVADGPDVGAGRPANI
jgi:hypothetical protein